MSAKKKPNGKAPASDGPPYVLTEAERNDILARSRFNTDNIDYEHKVCAAGLYDLEYEVKALAERIFNSRPDSDIWSQDEAREYASDAAAHARSLCDIANRMMRFAGRLEAYADCVQEAERADGAIEAYETGRMGERPFIWSEILAQRDAAKGGES